MLGTSKISPEMLMAMGGGILSGQNFAQGLGNGFSNAGTVLAAQKAETKAATSENQTRAWLQKQYPDQDFSQVPSEMLRTYASEALKSQFAKPDLPSIAEEYNFAKHQGFTGTFMDYQQSKANMDRGSNTPELGLNPQYGVDASGNPVLLQMSKDGKTVQSSMPEGVKLSKEPIKLDAGTHFVLLDPITRQNIGTVPKDVQGEQVQKDMGKTQAAAREQIGGMRQMASQIDKQVKDVTDDPDLGRVIGAFDGGWGSFIPNMTEGANRVQTKIDYLKGTAFIQGREFLKGQGQITDFESRKAEAAFSRMNQAQSETDFKLAMKDFNDAVQAGVKKVESYANGQWDTQPAQQPVTSGKTTGGNTWKVVE